MTLISAITLSLSFHSNRCTPVLLYNHVTWNRDKSTSKRISEGLETASVQIKHRRQAHRKVRRGSERRRFVFEAGLWEETQAIPQQKKTRSYLTVSKRQDSALSGQEAQGMFSCRNSRPHYRVQGAQQDSLWLSGFSLARLQCSLVHHAIFWLIWMSDSFLFFSFNICCCFKNRVHGVNKSCKSCFVPGISLLFLHHSVDAFCWNLRFSVLVFFQCPSSKTWDPKLESILKGSDQREAIYSYLCGRWQRTRRKIMLGSGHFHSWKLMICRCSWGKEVNTLQWLQAFQGQTPCCLTNIRSHWALPLPMLGLSSCPWEFPPLSEPLRLPFFVGLLRLHGSPLSLSPKYLLCLQISSHSSLYSLPYEVFPQPLIQSAPLLKWQQAWSPSLLWHARNSDSLTFVCVIIWFKHSLRLSSFIIVSSGSRTVSRTRRIS